MPNQSTSDLDPTPSDKGAVRDRPQATCSRLPFTPPFRLISEFRCGTDAHVVDAAGNIVIETSTWVSNPEINHKAAMLLIVDALNEKFPENA